MAGSLGYVETHRAVVATADNPLLMRFGGRLDHVEVAYETYGELNAAGDNAVFVTHALTGHAHAAGLHLGEKKRGWWDNLIGPGKALDTDRFFVVSPNILGGCSGTTGPLSINPATGRAYGPDFPLLHMADLAECHHRLLAHLGVERLHAGVGGSLGGMQILQMVADRPQLMDRAVVVAASSKLTAENIAFSTVAREAIMNDPDYVGGRYFEHGVFPWRGQKVARMMAHITYVSPTSLEDKFGRERRAPEQGWTLEPDFEVEHYLQHQGLTFLDRFDALSYLYLTRLLDYFDPFADEAARAGLAATPTRFQLTSFDSDWRFDTGHTERLATGLAELGAEVDVAELSSPHGHDSFLLETPGYHERIASFIAEGR